MPVPHYLKSLYPWLASQLGCTWKPRGKLPEVPSNKGSYLYGWLVKVLLMREVLVLQETSFVIGFKLKFHGSYQSSLWAVGQGCPRDKTYSLLQSFVTLKGECMPPLLKTPHTSEAGLRDLCARSDRNVLFLGISTKEAPFKLLKEWGNQKAYPAMMPVNNLSDQHGEITLWGK